MSNNLIVGILAGGVLIGVITLAILGINTQILLPILSVLVGYLVGKNENTLLGMLKK